MCVCVCVRVSRFLSLTRDRVIACKVVNQNSGNPFDLPLNRTTVLVSPQTYRLKIEPEKVIDHYTGMYQGIGEAPGVKGVHILISSAIVVPT